MTSGDSLQPAPAILTSNAPSSFDFGSTSRILRDRSSNPQYRDLKDDAGSFKFAIASPDKNALELHKSSYSQTALVASRSHGVRRTHYYARTRESEEDFQYLWRRLYECERYQKYRTPYEQARDTKGQKAEKWPLAREEAFFRAVLKWKPMGRKKKLPEGRGNRPLPYGFKNQALGRNELIALFINDWFGYKHKPEVVGRKKVSSHIQVLKAYFRSDPFVLWHLRSPKHEVKQPSRLSLNPERSQAFYEAPPSLSLLSSLPPLLPNAPRILRSQAAQREYAVVLRPHEFKMYIEDPTYRDKRSNEMHDIAERSGIIPTIHTITQSQPGPGILPKRLADLRGWQCYLPHLAQMEEAGELNCVVLLADSSLSVAVEQIRTHCKLTISYSLKTGPSMAHMREWQCLTRVFENGELMDVLEDADIPELEKRQIKPEAENSSLLNITFYSKYWAQKFHRFAGLLRGASIEPNLDPSNSKTQKSAREAIKRAEDEVKNEIKSITIVQEIFTADETNPQRRKRVSIIYWRFKQTKIDEIGLTTWRTLIPDGAEQESLTNKVGMNTIFDGGLDLAMNSSKSHLPPTATMLPIQRSYDMPMQHDLGMLSAAALFDPSTYDFQGLGGNDDSPSDGQSVSSIDHTAPGAESHQFLFEGNNPFAMPLVHDMASNGGALSLDDTLHAFDPSVLDGFNGAYWANGQSDNGTSLIADNLFGLASGTQHANHSEKGMTQTNSFQHYSKHPSTGEHANQLEFTDQHQHFHHHTHYTGFESMLGDSIDIAQWQPQEGQSSEQHQQQQQNQEVNLMHPVPRQMPLESHFALLAAQDQQESGQNVVDEAAELSNEHADGLDVAEMDWDAIMAGATAVATTAKASSADIAAPVGRPVPMLLPSAIEE